MGRLNGYKDLEVDKLGGLRSSNKTREQGREWQAMDEVRKANHGQIIESRPSLH